MLKVVGLSEWLEFRLAFDLPELADFQQRNAFQPKHVFSQFSLLVLLEPCVLGSLM